MPGRTNTKLVIFRVNELQYQILRTKASASGYKTISSYIRNLIFKEPYIVERLIKEIHKEIIGKN